jgi:hypothetical protein
MIPDAATIRSFCDASHVHEEERLTSASECGDDE